MWPRAGKCYLLFDNKTFQSIESFNQSLIEHLDYYNNDRIKAKLKGLSPVKFRTQSIFITWFPSNKRGALQKEYRDNLLDNEENVNNQTRWHFINL